MSELFTYNLRQYPDRSHLARCAEDWIKDKYTSGSYASRFMERHNHTGAYVRNYSLLIRYVAYLIEYLDENQNA